MLTTRIKTQLSKNNSNPPVHYTWFGKPATKEYKGHDTIGVELLRNSDSNRKIVFVCSDEQVSYYQTLFSKKPTHVLGMQTLARSHNDIEFANFIDKVMRDNNNSNNNKSKADIHRDCATLKELSQFYLQIYNHGYFLDTNVIPSPLRHDMLPNLPKYSCPYIKSRNIYDAWLMFSPNNDKEAMKRFHYHFKNVKQEYDDRKGKINRPFLNKTLQESLNIGQPAKLKAKNNANDILDNTYDLDCGMRKRYYNSHQSHPSTFKAPRNFYVLLTKDADNEFKYLVQSSKIDLHSIFSLPCQYNNNAPYLTTLAIQAVYLEKRFRTARKLSIMLPYIKDLNKKHSNPKKPNEYCTLLELATKESSNQCKAAILKEITRRKVFSLRKKGTEYYKKDNYEAAINSFLKVRDDVLTKDECAIFYYTFARSYEKIGNLKKANEYFSKSYDLWQRDKAFNGTQRTTWQINLNNSISSKQGILKSVCCFLSPQDTAALSATHNVCFQELNTSIQEFKPS